MRGGRQRREDWIPENGNVWATRLTVRVGHGLVRVSLADAGLKFELFANSALFAEQSCKFRLRYRTETAGEGSEKL